LTTAAGMILHLAPDHVDSRIGQGSHKDVAARKAYFKATGRPYRYVSLKGDEPAQIDAVLAAREPTHVLIEYSYYPRIAEHIRRRFPNARIGVRSINIEPLQHWTVADFESPMDIVRTVYVCIRLFMFDLQIGRTADHIYPISPLETRWYWPLLGFRKKTRWLPYIPPPEFRQAVGAQPRTLIACLPGVTSTRTRDMVNRFARFAQVARKTGWPQRFVISGTLAGWKVKLTPEVELAGYIEDLPKFYRDVAAVAVLTPLGYGFKTTVADAIWSGAKAIVNPSVHAELPEELKAHALVFKGYSQAELTELQSALLTYTDPGKSIDAVVDRFNREMEMFLAEGRPNKNQAMLE
jgi:hypothetical protein